MTRRRCFRLGGLLLAGLAIALLVPQGRYAIWGWLRGDHYYRGKPTCYWSSAVRSYEEACSSPPRPLSPLLVRLLGIRPNYGRPDQPAVLGGGRESIPVLIQLLRDRDKNVRRAAARALGDLGAFCGDGVPALAAALKDSDPEVRWMAADALYRIDPAAAGAIPDETLKQMVRDRQRVMP
ncbi:MAG TPA: HEAT repeat domain-containing protein [Gemmataceae bacterium]|nr:HEAT repeat domain-containing protein [Gemmataceae bacterium]